MKLLVLCLALVGSTVAMPVDDVSSQTSPEQPVALPALDAKSVVLPSETSAVQSKTADAIPSQDNLKAADSTALAKDAKVDDLQQNNVPVSSDALQVPASSLRSQIPNASDISGSSLETETAEKASDNQNQEIKREADPESQSKSVEADPEPIQPSEPIQQDALKNFPLINIADATNKLAAIAEENIPSAVKSEPAQEKNVDIIPQLTNSQSESSQLESNGKSEESETQEKREAELKPAIESKDEQPKIENPVVAEEPKDAKIEGKTAQPANISPAEEEISPPVVSKNEEISPKTVPIESPIISSVIVPAAKVSAAADSSVPLEGPVAGFIDDTVRVVRDTIEEIKGEKDAPKIDNSPPLAAAVPSVKLEEAVTSKTEDVSKKLDSAESNESKDEDSATSRRTNNSSQEESSEEKEKNAVNADAVAASSTSSASAVVPAIVSEAALASITV